MNLSALLLICIYSCISQRVVSSVISKRSFTVERVPNPHYTGPNGPRALARAYRKFNWPYPDAEAWEEVPYDDALKRQRPSHLADPNGRPKRTREADRNRLSLRDVENNDASWLSILQEAFTGGGGNGDGGPAGGGGGGGRGGGQTGIVMARPELKDKEYLSTVSIGGQNLNLDLDTGSSDLWIFTSQLPPPLRKGHNAYDASLSPTFRNLTGAYFVISYGDGSGANGTVGTDVVSMGGVEVQSQSIELATHVSESFAKDINSDGLLGLAFSQLNMVKPQKQMTFFENVKSSLRAPLFTAQLRRGSPGAFTFGYIDSTKYRGGLTWIPVNTTTGFWQFSSQSYATGGQQSQTTTPGAQAIADTGTTLILADPKIVTGYYKEVRGAHEQKQAKGYVIPCNATLPDLYLDIGGLYMARIHGADLNYSELNDGSDNCFGGLQAVAPGGMGIYGDIFFKSQFVVFNGGNNTLGMAPHSGAPP